MGSAATVVGDPTQRNGVCMAERVDAQRTSRGWIGLAGMGVEFAGAVGGFCLLGYWIDRHWEIENHLGLLLGALLGLVGGGYNMIRQALRASRTLREGDERRRDDGK